MKPRQRLVCLILLVLYFDHVSNAVDEGNQITTTTASSTSEVPPTPSKDANKPKEPKEPNKPKSIPSIALRTVIVVSAVCALVIVYFIVRAICTRRRKNRTRRYGMLKDNRRNGEDDMELHPLSELDDDDDDDLTLFDANQSRKKNRR